MANISPQRIALLEQFVSDLPGGILDRLCEALMSVRDGPMFEVRRLVETEAKRRIVIARVFHPYIKMFERRRDGLDSYVFPKWLLNNLWTELGKRHPDLVQQATRIMDALDSNDPVPVVFIQLAGEATALLHDQPDSVLPPKAQKADREEAIEFSHYLDLYRTLNKLLGLLPECAGRMDPEKEAALRVLYKDVSSLSERGGPHMVEVILSQLDAGAQILKFISAITDRRDDRFLADSELCEMGTRLVEWCEDDLKLALSQFKNETTEPNAIKIIHEIMARLQVFEQNLELSRDGPWGKRLAVVRKEIAAQAESRLNGLEKMVELSLPQRKHKGRTIPRYEKPGAEETVNKAVMALKFIKSINNLANQGGFGALYTKVITQVETLVNGYVEDMVSSINSEDAPSESKLETVFEHTCKILEALFSESEANLARRRVAAAFSARHAKSVA